MSVWDDLVGQDAAVATLQRAVAADGSGDRHAMSHAWLITGPPGSGRSNAARAFAAALQCPSGGCGTCSACRTALTGAHPDVTLVRTEQLSIGVDEVRDLARRAAMSPTLGPHQVLVVEDADRVTERGADALLKSIEEPAPRTVWVLCAPTPDDVVVTIRSRCRQLHLVTPSDEAVARLLERRDGIDPALAAHAARAAQGHVGRARALARDEAARNRRHEILKIPGQLVSVGACLTAAANIVKASADEAAQATADLDARERAELSEALGMGTKGARPRNVQAALKELDDQQKARAKRLQRDALDRVLTELTTFERDVLVAQTVPDRPDRRLVNPELREAITSAARTSTPEATIRRIDALLAARTALEGNVAPLLAIEAMLLAMADPEG
ncbi:MAG TPA: DNA polymerase III subunit delta' [Propionibacteriaceae bacterium]|nr:DNA polymerase III subunit delta' [Propionibacteriaceae bacterium]